MSGWCTIESDPGVFTELLDKFGSKGLQVEELWDLEDATFDRFNGSVYGLIFLFKWDKTLQASVAESTLDTVPDGLFFAKQMINNACATQAILNILLNLDDSTLPISLGETLTNFRKFTGSLDPESAGIALEQSEPIRVAHNSFARPEPIHFEIDKDDRKEEDAFHFISYVNKSGIVYELDGLQKGPRLLGSSDSPSDWWKTAKPAIQKRMSDYAGTELRFTLLAITRNLKDIYTEELESLSADDASCESRRSELRSLIQDETEKFESWRKANIRRRHNYFPFIFELFKVLAEKNVLSDITARAVEKKAEFLKNKKAEDEAAAAAAKTDSDAAKTGDVPMTDASS